MKKKILVVGQTPPPFGGQAMMIKRMLDGSYQHIELYHVRMSFSEEMSEMGVLKLHKLTHLISIILKIIYYRIRCNIRVLYYPPSGPSRLPMLRDMAILLCTRWMFNKTIFHFHAAGIGGLYSQLPVYLQVLYRWSYFKPDIAIILSENNPNDDEVLQAKERYIIPNGIEDVYQLGSYKKSVEDSVVSILFVGMVCQTKGVLVLLEAVKMTRERGINVRVNILGEFASARFRLTVNTIIKEYHLEGDVNFLGVMTGRDKWDLYTAADIFCFPTYFESESFGLVVVEAMQFSVPVIVTKWRGVQSLITDGEEGYLVPVENSIAVAEKLTVLATDQQLRERMGRKGRERYLDQYTLEQFYQHIDECLREA